MKTRKTSARAKIWLSSLMALMIVLGCCVPMGMATEATPGEAEKCLHETTVMDYQKINYRDYEDHGDGTHAYVYDFVTTELCQACYQTIDQTTDIGLVGYEEHEGDPCSKCGWTAPCQHSNAVVTTEERTTYCDLDPNNPEKQNEIHIRHFDTYEVTTCPDCDYVSEVKVGGGKEPEEHDGDPCSQCGWTYVCPHANVETITYDRSVSGTDNGDGTHTEIYDTVRQQHCKDCDMWMEEEVLSSGLTRTQNHNWDSEGICWVCGAKNTCTHANVETITVERSVSGTDNGDGTHTEIYDTVRQQHCEDCDMCMEEEVLSSGLIRTQKHNWDSEGICWVCGAKNICTHENLRTLTYERSVSGTDNGDGTHTEIYDTVRQQHCEDCDMWTEEEVLSSGLTRTQKHSWDSEGICWVCDAKNTCTHQRVVETDGWRYDTAVFKDNGDGKTHTITAMTTIERVCSACDAWLSDEDTGVKTWSEYHQYTEDGGACEYCGYVNTCSHPTLEDRDIWHSVEWTDNGDGKTHTASYELWTVKMCPTCGWFNWDTETFVKNSTTVEEHWFKNGYCTECLADEPAATATPAPAKTPAPSGGNSGNGGGTTVKQPEADVEFVATPEPEATAAPEMVSTLLDTVAQAEAEGSEVTVEVVGAQEVFSETEYEQLKTLPAQEQMLVTLASIGLEDVVQSALASMNVTLSEEAEALTAQVAERFAAMGEEERAQVEEKLAQLFPKTQVTVGEKTYEYFVIDLQITVDGMVRVERYGFRYDEELGQWVFEKLDLIDMYVEAE